MVIYMNALIGNTRVLEYNGIYIKYEIDNLTNSVKDRAAFSFMKYLKNPSKTFVCATSGNLGISLAKLCKLNKQKLLIIMPESNSIKKQMMENEYTTILETSALEGLKGSLKLLNKYKYNNDYICINQFTSLYNPLAYIDLCREIVKEFKTLDYIVLGIGSGGTYYTVKRVLKRCYPNIKIIGILPSENDYIEGIGANVFNHSTKIKKEIRYVTRKDAILKTKEINEVGIPLGISSGACYKVCEDLKKENPNGVILMIAHDSNDRYRDTLEEVS